MNNIVELLDALADARDEAETIRLWTEDARQALIPAEVKQAIADLDAEIAPRQSAITERIAELETKIKDAVVSAGETVKGARIQAVFTKGRESWDSKGLSGYAVAHPEIQAFRKVGEPSVSLRSK